MVATVICVAVVTDVPAMVIVKYKSIAVPDGTLKYCNVNKKRIIG
jgi:hypothetical protein